MKIIKIYIVEARLIPKYKITFLFHFDKHQAHSSSFIPNSVYIWYISTTSDRSSLSTTSPPDVNDLIRISSIRSSVIWPIVCGSSETISVGAIKMCRKLPATPSPYGMYRAYSFSILSCLYIWNVKVRKITWSHAKDARSKQAYIREIVRNISCIPPRNISQ